MAKSNLTCNTVIIGAGSAGLAAYEAAGEKGRCILVESGPLGTTARRTGDTPMTLLMEAGRSVHEIVNAKKHGINIQGEFLVDSSEVMNALRSVRARATSEVLSLMYRIPEDQRVMGRASFIDDHHLKVGEDVEIEFKTAVIATGTTAQVPYELQSLQGILTTDSIFELERLPKAVAVIGSGSTGLQLGQALCHLGVKVAVFGLGKMWHYSDDAVISAASELLQDSFSLILNATITSIEGVKGGRLGIYYLDERRFENYLEVDNVISTSIRPPRTRGLNLKNIGISCDSRGFIKVDKKTLQTTVPHIFAAGDVISGTYHSTVNAKLTGLAAGTNAMTFPVVKNIYKDPKIAVLFTDPGLAVVGLCLDEMKRRASLGSPFVCSEVRLEGGRFRILRKEGGIIRLYTDCASHQVMGAELCCTGAEHLAHFLRLCILKGLTVEEIAKVPCYQPCLEEAVPVAALAALKTLKRKSGDYVL